MPGSRTSPFGVRSQGSNYAPLFSFGRGADARRDEQLLVFREVTATTEVKPLYADTAAIRPGSSWKRTDTSFETPGSCMVTP